MKLAILWRMSRATLLLVAAMQVGCGGGSAGGSGTGSAPQQSAPAPKPTAQGTANGVASTAVVGTEGGAVASADGRLLITVPAGALDRLTTITIQPITNHAHGGVGAAFRLTPEGSQFSKPVTLSFNYSDADVAGSAPEALGVAFQRPDGTWEWTRGPAVDAEARTVTVQTTHFSDWSAVRGFVIRPSTATVAPGKTLSLKVAYCYPPEGGELLAPLGFECEKDDALGGLSYLQGTVGEWSVDGILGGSGTKGTVTGEGMAATFTAPSSKPTPDTVTVSARVQPRQSTKILVMATVKIADPADYSGTLDFQNAFAAGKFTVDWKDTDGTGALYKAIGTVELTTQVPGCVPQQLTFPIDSRDWGVGGYMRIYDPTGAVTKQYAFHLLGEGADVTLSCDTGPQTFSVADLSAILVGTGACTDQTPSYADKKKLAGTFACPDSSVTANWVFDAP